VGVTAKVLVAVTGAEQFAATFGNAQETGEISAGFGAAVVRPVVHVAVQFRTIAVRNNLLILISIQT
jgi:hypothetical protein